MPYETPETRYSALSQMLSGVQLFPRNSRPVNCICDFFAPPKPGLFCGKWTTNDVASLLAETGCVAHWKEQGFTGLRVECTQDFDNRYTMTVWTRFGEVDEMLCHLIVWLEYVAIERLNASYPAFCVEHLRLQAPGKDFIHPRMPGQDFASSGLLRRFFSIIQLWASQLGAAIITQIPQYFHTAWLFMQYFDYVDLEMHSIYRAVCEDLLPHGPSFDEAIELSHDFENGKIRRNGEQYLWPTELQAFPLAGELVSQISVGVKRDNAKYTKV